MKKLLVLVMAFLALSVLECQAEIITKEAKVGIAYCIDGNNPVEIIGSSIKEGVFIKGLDIDLFIASELGKTLNTDNKVVLPTLSYNYNFAEKASLFVTVGLGISRIEKMRAHEWGESDKYIGAGIGYKF